MNRNNFMKFLSGSTLAAAVSTVGEGAGASLNAQTSAKRNTAKNLGSNLYFSDFPSSGVRRLGRDKFFTSWKAGLEPAYRVKLGELLLVELQHALPGRVSREGFLRDAQEGDAINPQTGPIYVEDLAPGEALAIDILEIRTGDWGYAGGRMFEMDDGFAVFDERLRLAMAPMLGCIGVAPATGEMDTRAPGPTGGNMDCTQVRAGSTVVFSAQVPGALVGFGDTHALQGDGEISGQGIETEAEVLLRFRKLPERETLSERPVIRRAEYLATLSAQEDLNEAAWQAADDMVKLLSRVSGRPQKEARMLVNLLGDLKINQIVDPTKGARMEVPLWVFGL